MKTAVGTPDKHVAFVALTNKEGNMSTLAYARPTLVRYGAAVAVTRMTTIGSTFDGGNALSPKKSETKSGGQLSAQNTDLVGGVSTTTNNVT